MALMLVREVTYASFCWRLIKVRINMGKVTCWEESGDAVARSASVEKTLGEGEGKRDSATDTSGWLHTSTVNRHWWCKVKPTAEKWQKIIFPTPTIRLRSQTRGTGRDWLRKRCRASLPMVADLFVSKTVNVKLICKAVEHDAGELCCSELLCVSLFDWLTRVDGVREMLFPCAQHTRQWAVRMFLGKATHSACKYLASVLLSLALCLLSTPDRLYASQGTVAHALVSP
ncbi:hypothetical protein TRVL_08445 [Trypanosoma vivax]|nr:hypothetical protein TRVL_08445 [Trypanosoma vivax]